MLNLRPNNKNKIYRGVLYTVFRKYGSNSNSRPVIADSHHFDEEQNSDSHISEKLDPDPHLSEELDPDPH
jgi:hypothetical protein